MQSTEIFEVPPIITHLRAILNDEKVQDQFRSFDHAFTRKGKFTFSRLIGVLLTKQQHAIPARINSVFDTLGKEFLEDWPKKAAFLKARQKIQPLVFEYLLDQITNLFYTNPVYAESVTLWHGFHVLAVDGSKVEIPKTEETKKTFSFVTFRYLPEGKVQAQASVLHDVLNGIPLHAVLSSFQSETKLASTAHSAYLTQMIETQKWNVLVLYDRGYTDYHFIAVQLQTPCKFVIRSKTTGGTKAVRQFMQSPEQDTILTIDVPPNAKKIVKEQGLPSQIQVRAVKVVLDSGETEVLLTNLFDKEKYPLDCFKDLYFKRWGVETGYNYLKNTLNLEKFSSKLVSNIFQDFYSHLFLYGLCSILVKHEQSLRDAQESENKEGPPIKYHYRFAFTTATTGIFCHLTEILIKKNVDMEEIYWKIRQWMKSNLIPDRPGRKYPRNKKTNSARFGFWSTIKKQVS